jgi:DNA invertase Pin-like site-specific DNA recombinase
MKGDSVKRQKSLIMKWVKSNGYSVRGEYWDVESGSKDTMNRPEFMRMISDSERMDI